MQYYIEYTLGIRGPSNQKADKGTITHKILEICALCAQARQQGKDTIEDDIVGTVETDNPNPEYLENIMSKVYRYYSKNLSHHRWTASDYKDCCAWAWKALKHQNGMFDPRSRDIVDAEPFFDFEIKHDWARIEYPEHNIEGRLSLKGTIDLITRLDEGIYEIIDWKGLPIDTLLSTPHGWTTMGDVQVGDMVIDIEGRPTKVVGKSQVNVRPCYRLSFSDSTTAICDNEHLWFVNNGEVKKITDIQPGDIIPASPHSQEKRIDYITPVASRETQCISVDSPTNTYLCTQYMIPTHNTGRRLDWATGKEKTQESLYHDPQLRLYHYAAKHLYPDVHTFLITIFFINDGGPFTVQFLDEDIPETERMIRERFEFIRDTDHPERILETRPNDSWKCYRLCHAGKTSFRKSKPNPRDGKPMSICEQVNWAIKTYGIDWVTKHYKHPDHIIGKYKAPGSVE